MLTISRAVYRLSKFRLKANKFHSSAAMANSKYEYVRTYENEDKLLQNCWAVARIDGRGFHKLAKLHRWTRPNDERALKLMNTAAKYIMSEYNEIMMAYGQSDEYSFVFRREAEIFQRRSTKIITTLVSQFASAFVFYWREYFPDLTLEYPPSFDGRMVLYPTDKNLRDYLSWRQADCHINNLYNTTFWTLVLKGAMSNTEAEKRLCGTLSGDKNEILFSEFGINYNNEPELFRKGTILVQKEKDPNLKTKFGRREKYSAGEPRETKVKLGFGKQRFAEIQENYLDLNCDLIGDKFWADYPYLLNPPGPSPRGKAKSAEKEELQQQTEDLKQ